MQACGKSSKIGPILEQKIGLIRPNITAYPAKIGLDLRLNCPLIVPILPYPVSLTRWSGQGHPSARRAAPLMAEASGLTNKDGQGREFGGASKRLGREKLQHTRRILETEASENAVDL